MVAFIFCRMLMVPHFYCQNDGGFQCTVFEQLQAVTSHNPVKSQANKCDLKKSNFNFTSKSHFWSCEAKRGQSSKPLRLSDILSDVSNCSHCFIINFRLIYI